MWQRWLIVLLFLTLAAPLAQAATTPTADFTDNGDGTATHKTTGLTWKRCAEGMTQTGSGCSGTAQTYTWVQAKALTAGDWRLPTIAELVTIVERDNYPHAINATIFPDTPASNFWSASANALYSGYAWVISFNGGYDSTFNVSGSYSVRLVRGGQPLDSSGLYTPTPDFSDNGDGSVTHKKTSLTWKRCAEGMNWTGSTCSGAAQSYAWSTANALGTGGWRLPTQNELLTIVEWSKYNPAINTTIFPGTPASVFWSASASNGNLGGAWYVDFSNGGDYGVYKPGGYSVRLVRGGQSAPPSAPIFLSSTPSSALVNVATTVTVQAGTDPEGAQVNANCSATNSDYPDSANASLSGLGSGGRSVQHSFTFYATGTQTIYCTSFDASGNASATVSMQIAVTAQATGSDLDFTDNGDGTVTHKITGLTWKRCVVGMTWTGSTCSGAANTYTWDQAMALGSNGWGMPTKEQLLSIVDSSRSSPSINTTIFPGTPSSGFWSASVLVLNSVR